MPTANEAVRDRIIRHQHYLERFKSGSARKLTNLLTKVESDLVAQIVKRDPTGVSRRFTDVRLRKLLDEVRDINAAAVAEFRTGLYDEVKSLGAYEAGFSANLVRTSIPVAFDVVTPSSVNVYAAIHARPFQGRLLKEWFKDLEPRTFSRLRDAIRMGVVQGETVDQIIRRVRGTRALGFRDGIMEMNRRGADAVVRTAVQHTVSEARQITFRENEHLISGVGWVSTLDHGTCVICGARDGQVYAIDKGPRPPAHIRCRCTTVPILKSWRELGINLKEAPAGTRASMDGQVPESITYNRWLKGQPANIQDEALGSTRGRLFRKGGLEVKDFVNTRGDIYTLGELEKLEKAAFSKAA